MHFFDDYDLNQNRLCLGEKNRHSLPPKQANEPAGGVAAELPTDTANDF